MPLASFFPTVNHLKFSCSEWSPAFQRQLPWSSVLSPTCQPASTAPGRALACTPMTVLIKQGGTWVQMAQALAPALKQLAYYVQKRRWVTRNTVWCFCGVSMWWLLWERQRKRGEGRERGTPRTGAARDKGLASLLGQKAEWRRARWSVSWHFGGWRQKRSVLSKKGMAYIKACRKDSMHPALMINVCTGLSARLCWGKKFFSSELAKVNEVVDLIETISLAISVHRIDAKESTNQETSP